MKNDFGMRYCGERRKFKERLGEERYSPVSPRQIMSLTIENGFLDIFLDTVRKFVLPLLMMSVSGRIALKEKWCEKL